MANKKSKIGNSFISRALMCALLLCFPGCDSVIRHMNSSEIGLVFRDLPRMFGGGLTHEIVRENQKKLLFPWEKIYSIERNQKSIHFGSATEGAIKNKEDSADGLVYTRASDGTEVALRVAVTYQIKADAESLYQLFDQVATEPEPIRALVASIARSDIRTFFSQLNTSQFADVDATEKAVSRVKESMNKRLRDLGIEIPTVSFLGFQFERLRRDGTVDARYQTALKNIRELIEKTEMVRAATSTIKDAKEAELSNEQANYNQRIQEAEALKLQAANRGDNYFQIRKNEAEAIKAQGEAEVTGIIDQINALSGPGGAAILKLDLAKALLQSDPKFVLLSEGQGKNQIGVNRVDTNDLINQIGIFEGLKSKQPTVAPVVSATPSVNAAAEDKSQQETN